MIKAHPIGLLCKVARPLVLATWTFLLMKIEHCMCHQDLKIEIFP